MKNIIKEETYRAFHNHWIKISIGIGLIIAILQIITSKSLIQGFYNIYSNGGNNMYAGKVAYTFTIWDGWIGLKNCALRRLIFFVMPLLATMPFCCSLCSDMKSGYANQICSRTGKKQYFIAKAFAGFMSGGFTAVIPFIINMCLWLTILPVSFPNPVNGSYGINGLVAFSKLFYENPIVYFIIFIIYIFLFYGLLSCMALVFSLLDDNIFIVAIFPFTAFFVIHTICAYMGVSYYSPVEMIIMPTLQKNCMWAMGVMLFVMAAGLLFYIKKSRCDNLK